jgi:polyisoprenoid-binding protein YceI
MVMKHRWIALLAGALLAAPVQARLPEGSYAMAATQSRVSASVSFFSVSQKKVAFPTLTGAVRYRADGVGGFDLRVTVDATQLDAGDKTDNDMLKGTDFFDTNRFREVVFHGTRLRLTGPKSAIVDGQLSVRGVSRPLSLKVSFPQPLETMARQGKMDLTATARFKRSAYGMKAWPVVVGDKVNLTINARFDRQ